MRDQSRVYYVLVAANHGFFAVAFTLLLVYQVSVAGLSAFQLVVVGTVLEITCFLGEVPTGLVADVWSRRLSVLIGFVLIGLSLILQGSLATFWWILAAQVVWGLGYTFTSGAVEAWIFDEAGPDVFLRGQRVALVASILGTCLAGALGAASLRLPMLVAGAGYLILVAVLLLIMREHNFVPGHDRGSFTAMRRVFVAGVVQARRHPVVRSFLLISLLAGLSSEAFDRLWTAHVLASFTLPVSPAVFFAAFAVAGQLLALLANIAVSRAARSPHPSALLALLTLAQVVGMAGLAVLQNLWLALGSVLVRDASRALSEPLQAAWLNRNVDSASRATVLSVNNQFDAIGQIVGGPPLGALAGRTSIRVALLASAGLLAPVAVLFSRLGRAARGPDPATRSS
ncbi:MFS transporter [Actinoplanes sp. NPDC051861]|uniref:MFS transporter n=1 Tax=Actinoplanes sp. NPDC051861 TaxID=3155170 RepID=UPI0034490319